MKTVKIKALNEDIESRETIEVSDIKLMDQLTSIDVNTVPDFFENEDKEQGQGQKITSAKTNTFSSEFMPIAKLLASLLPMYLDYYFDIDYNKPLEKKFKTKGLEPAIDSVIASLTKSKNLTARLKKNLLLLKKLKTIKTNDDLIDTFETILEDLKFKLLATLDTFDKKFLRKVYSIYMNEEVNEESMIELFRMINKIPSKSLRTLFKSIKLFELQPKQMYEDAKTHIDKITSKLFGTPTPTIKTLEAFEKKSKTKYSNWKKEINWLNREAKAYVEDAWIEKGFDIVPVVKANAFLKSINVESPIDPGFQGQVSLGDSPSVVFKYYTKNKLLLAGVPGKDVVMNPNYDYKNDDNKDGYYCTSLSKGSFKTDRKQLYTLKHRQKSNGDIFVTISEVYEAVEDVRIQYNKDIKTLKKKDRKKWLAAVVIKLIDITWCRIGNRKSENNVNKKGEPRPTYGIHNLLGKHVKLNGDKARLIFQGKDDQLNDRPVNDTAIVAILRSLKKIAKFKGYMFTAKPGNDNPISKDFIKKYAKSIGFPGTLHKFRHFHASSMFSEFLDNAKTQPWQKKTVLKKFDKIVKKISENLSNQPTAALTSYIDHSLVISYFQHFKVDMPDKVKSALQKGFMASKGD